MSKSPTELTDEELHALISDLEDKCGSLVAPINAPESPERTRAREDAERELDEAWAEMHRRSPDPSKARRR